MLLWIPFDPVQEGNAIAHRTTNLGVKLIGRSCLAPNNGKNLSLKLVDDVLGVTALLGVHHDALLVAHLADHEKLLPPIYF